MENQWQRISGTVAPGYGVASGQGHDPRYPEGTLAMQWPIFAELGLPLEGIFRGTLNIDISPRRFELTGRDWHFPLVKWSPHIGPETFSFSRCRVHWQGQVHDALIYYPHPETKPEHFQSDSTLEVLAPRLEGISYGSTVELDVKPELKLT
ncbi:hypothetical protein [Ruficoccus sp. ZRK36]|uniref:hypothetical protein n=1 Tax=Ruficoccus sp. ZRK36 TaxID=2866311 RepID=UPI001C72CC22|nr:hypothetical protein [Ruficoccus sp. ZRK36]QYY35690.1 hypothetical protein K0V07_15495 [Ruficoccus sp. ZRK36]